MEKINRDFATFITPFGNIGLEARDGALTKLTWHVKEEISPASDLMTQAAAQLAAYFDHEIDTFDLPLAPQGSAFHQDVWQQMQAIPQGETRTYGEVAKALMVAAQPVGQACGANPIPIIIPCHRIVGTGHLGGFSAPGGVETKVALLKHEGAYSLLI